LMTEQYPAQRRLILASASPRRLALLCEAGLSPEVIAPVLDEAAIVDAWDGACAADLAMQLALSKAEAVRGRLGGDAAYSKSLILAADTIVYKDAILGKPKDAAEALAMLMSLSGSAHQVYTGTAIIDLAKGGCKTACDCTTVRFSRYSSEEAQAYIATGEPMDKAGAYAIQGAWGAKVQGINGDYNNVVGLPTSVIAALAQDAEIT